jgi:hypothetical protein
MFLKSFPAEWDDSWSDDRKVGYISLHPEDRDKRLREGGVELQKSYFAQNGAEASGFYKAHPQLAKEIEASEKAAAKEAAIKSANDLAAAKAQSIYFLN